MSLTSMRRCVICYKSMDDASTLINTSLEKQLSVIFFLRKFLKYSLISEEDGVLDSLLITHGHPSDWIQFCPPCSETVIEAQKVYLNLTEIEAKLTSLRELVELKVAHSFDEFEEEIAVHQSYCDDPDNRTFFTVRQAIFEKGFKKITPTVSSPAFLEVKVKEENLSHEDLDYPDTSYQKSDTLIPEIEECIITPECLPLKETKEKEEFQDDECLSPSNFIFTSKGQTSASKRKHGNVPTTSQKGESFQYKYRTKGPKKSSVESRTCPVCHQIFEKPSLLTRHKRSHVIKGDLMPAKDISTGGAELSTNRSMKNENGPTTITKKLSSFKYKYTTKGLKKSSVESRTCPVCHEIFAKPSLLTIHVRSHVSRGELLLATVLLMPTTNTINEESSRVNNGECNNFVQMATTTTKQRKVNSGVLPDKMKGLPSKKRRKRNPVSFKKKSADGHCELEKGKRYKDSDHDWKAGKSESEVFGDEEESTKKTEGQFDDPPLSRKLKVQRPRRNKCDPEDRTCPICKKKFKDICLMRMHLKCLHEKKDSYVCEICGKTYSWPTGLMQHKKEHQDGWTELKSRFKCTFEGCKWAFRLRTDWTKHEKIHLSEKKISCNLCGASFRFPKILVRHQKLHSEEKEHVCSICGDRFRHRGNLLRHNLCKHQIHPQKDPENLFVCEQCGKSFNSKSHLNQHLKTKIHGGPGFKTKTSTSGTPRKRAKRNPKIRPSPKEQRDLTLAVAEPVQVCTNPGYPTDQPQANISNTVNPLFTAPLFTDTSTIQADVVQIKKNTC